MGASATAMATLVASVAMGPPAGAAPGEMAVYADPAGLSSTDEPIDLVEGADGRIWFTSNMTNRIGRIDPDAVDPASTIETFADPAGTASTERPYNLTAGPDGRIWYGSTGNGRIGRIDPLAEDPAASIETFADPGGMTNTPGGLTVGPDGWIWFTSAGTDRIGRIDPLADAPAATIETFADPAGTASTDGPTAITAGADGWIWYTSQSNDRIGRIDPLADVPALTMETFADPAGTASTDAPLDIAAGPDGWIWYAARDSHSLGRIDPLADDPASTIETFSNPNTVAGVEEEPQGLTASPDGNIWYTESAYDRIGRITPAASDPTSTFTSFADLTGVNDFPIGITSTSDGEVWFTGAASETLGRLEPPAANDVFALAEELTGTSGSVAGDTRGTTREPGEPITENAGDVRERSVWYRYTAPHSGTLTVDTCEGSTADTIIGIYVGDDVDALTAIASADRTCGFQSRASTHVVAGTTYHIVVDDRGDASAAAPFTLGWLLEGSFSDVPFAHPFYEDIDWMADQGISTGYPDGTYKPSAVVSRQAMSAFMYRLAGEPPFTVPGDPTFSDVPGDHPFFAEIEWMADVGVSTGYGDGTYKPSDAVTRQAMSAFMYRLAGEPPFTAPGAPSFGDVPLTHPFYDEIEWMADTEITTGYAGNVYRPAAAVSRQAMSAFMHRLADGPGVGV